MAEIIIIPDELEYFGAATAAHQIEGGNRNDLTEWEHANAERLAAAASPDADYGAGQGPVPHWDEIEPLAKDPASYISGRALDSWNRWEEDLDLAEELGLNALRFSVEWSRIKPSADVTDPEALKHYAQIVAACRARGIEPFITLHHFSNPQWFARQGGWERPESAGVFADYVAETVPKLEADGAHWLVINEPEVYSGFGYMLGSRTPNKHNPLAYRRVNKNLIEAHKQSFERIKAADEAAQVSSAVNEIHVEPGDDRLHNRALARAATFLLNNGLVHNNFREATIDEQDFVGLNTYWHCKVQNGLFKGQEDEPRSDTGWYLNPESMYHLLKGLQRFDKPVIITEHGLADGKDRYREWYITQTLAWVVKAMREGVDVRGYMHWTLADNFEWDMGRWPKFGLAEVDPVTLERTLRPSARAYSNIIQTRQLAVA